MKIKFKGWLLAVMGLFVAGGVAVCVSFSNGQVITDPDSAAFDPMQFKFEHYSKGAELCSKTVKAVEVCRDEFNEVINKIFPRGTEKVYVEKILMTQAHASLLQSSTEKNIYYYNYEGRVPRIILGGGKWQVKAIYDSENKLQKISGMMNVTSF